MPADRDVPTPPEPPTDAQTEAEHRLVAYLTHVHGAAWVRQHGQFALDEARSLGEV
jgi:hypothetical protein